MPNTWGDEHHRREGREVLDGVLVRAVSTVHPVRERRVGRLLVLRRRLVPVVCLAREAGLRVRELKALRWREDVDLIVRTLTYGTRLDDQPHPHWGSPCPGASITSSAWDGGPWLSP